MKLVCFDLDDTLDIPVLGYCGTSIALNSSPEVQKYATYAVDSDDLSDILEYILKT